MLTLAGCQKGLFEMKGGKEVVFTATSAVGTKAAYGDASGGYQRIDWEEGDDIVIFSNLAKTQDGNNSSVYLIKSPITTSGATSKAGLDNQGSGLRYLDSEDGPYWFAGAYPSTGLSLSGTSATVTGSIPSEQTITANGFPSMENTLMLSDPTKVNKDEAVSLYFKPLFTTFEIKCTAEEDMQLVGFMLQSESSNLNGSFNYVTDLSVQSPEWTEPTESDGSKTIQVTFPSAIDLKAGKDTTFGFYTVPFDATDLAFKFFVKLDGSDVQETRALRVTYAKDDPDGKYSQGQSVVFAGGKKHNISGITIPANMSDEIVIDLAVIPWDDASEDPYTITYGPDAVVNALALEYASGAAITSGSGRRTNNNFANATDPIHSYFSVYSPVGNGAKWKIKVTGATSKLLVSADNATSTPTDDGLELTGATGGRVHFTIDRGTGDNAPTASDQIQLNFFVVLNGREINMNSEITRGGALTITGKVGQ